MLYREEDMPFTTSGMVPSIIMNPHAIPSRMTIGQLMEALESKACAHWGATGDATPFNGRTVEDIAAELEAGGMERYGNEVMINPRTGEQVPCSVFVCPTYYQRLKHMVEDKVHCLTGDHEVLTIEGWKPIGSVTLDDEVATLKDGNYLVYERPLEIFRYLDYEGPMCHVEGPRVDLFVTMGHRMWASRGKRAFEFIYARDLGIGEEVEYKHDAKWEGDEEEVDFDFWQATSESARRVLSAMDLVGVGLSDEVADAVTRLCLHAGLSATVSKEDEEGWRVEVHHDGTSKAAVVEVVEDFKGAVHCLRVPSEVFYVRRTTNLGGGNVVKKACWTGNSRAANGPVVMLTRQPAEGRARDGGLRLGEMELECLWAHGSLFFLKERFMECSDNYRVFVCKECGMMAQVNPEKGIYFCRACKNITNFSEVRIPYACKLLLQEIQTMSIGARFIT